MTNLFHAYDLRGTTMEQILKSYIERHGTPPNPLEVAVHKNDSESVILESVNIQKRIAPWILPHNVFLGVEEKVDD